MKGFKVTVRGVFYELRACNEFMGEWDLYFDGKMLCDSESHQRCIEVFLALIEDSPLEIEKYLEENY